ncbi:MAG: 4-hydroxy-tetrahydrodipicolinate reductase [Ferruginibacter sp.]|nr:4-hydroxy-tetrahydrodipicolinate reductase [Cytophagales bacterium]
MRVLLLGYGKMGKVIERVATARNHVITARIDAHNQADMADMAETTPPTDRRPDVAIEFSQPDAAFANLRFCLEHGIPVVCGTTGWLGRKPEIEQLTQEKQGAFFYASNFSIGVNLFFRLNALLAKWMNAYPQYEVSVTEVHHTEKKDAPSGTALTLTEGLLAALKRKTAWTDQPAAAPHQIAVHSVREGNVPGTHTIQYDSAVDQITITHAAHSREGFALGAVLAAEWLVQQRQAGRHGVFGMEEMMDEK